MLLAHLWESTIAVPECIAGIYFMMGTAACLCSSLLKMAWASNSAHCDTSIVLSTTCKLTASKLPTHHEILFDSVTLSMAQAAESMALCMNAGGGKRPQQACWVRPAAWQSLLHMHFPCNMSAV